MAIRFKCSCGKIYTVKDDFAGKVATCKACGKKVRIPSPKAAPAAAAPAPPAASPQASAAPPPAPAPKAGGGRGKMFALIGGAVVLLLVLGVAAFFIFGGKEEPKPKPEPVAKKPPVPTDIFPGESLVPANALVFASLPSYEESEKRFKETAIYQMTQDPALKGLTDPLMTMLRQKLSEGEAKALQKTGLTIQDITTSFSKGFSLAFMAPADPAKPDKPQTLVIVKPTSMDQLDAIISKMAEKSQAKQGEYEAEGLKVKSLSGKDGEVGYVALGEFVAASDSRAVLGAAIRQHKAGRGGSLGADAHYAQVAKRLAGEASDFFLYVNGAQVLKEISKKKPIPQDAANAAGLSSIKSVVLAASIRDKGIRDGIYINTEGPKTGVIGFLSPEPLSADVLKQIPQDADGFLAGRMNLPLLYQVIKKIATAGKPEKAAQWDQAVGMSAQMLGADLEKALLPAFGNEYCFYTRTMAGAPIPIPEIAILLGVKDKAKLQPVLSMLEMMLAAKMAGGKPGAAPQPWKAMPHAGETIKYTNLPLPLPIPIPLNPSYALTDKFLIISISTQAVKNAIDNAKKPGEGIAASADFKHVTGGFGGGFGVVGYSNLKKGVTQAMGVMPMMAPMLAQKGIPIDPAKLPAPDALAKHLFGGAIVMKGDEGGLSIQGFSPVGVTSAFPLMSLMGMKQAQAEAKKRAKAKAQQKAAP